ncbi:potassium channel subfamily K member 1-like isoform X1 [Limulus polyphemus]|uniref:Potassium channel subfamily K member 1 n=1 Tax=Limulus polyphemus TaxID=6850 RepID=A0ABM1TDW4_LIMPO|nr:potassium channel subfamily K member 1-like isoform X1 [Limulus polyphemus]
MKEIIRQNLRRSNVRLALLTAFYILVLTIGALIFWATESPEEIDMIHMLRSKRSQFLDDYSCVTDEDLEAFVKDIISGSNRGVRAVRNVTMEPNWSFGQSVFFSTTVVTTIGYGQVRPLSQGGKIFCIIYGLVGIPLTMTLLSAYVERLMIPAVFLLQFLNSRLGHLFQPFNIRMFHLSIVGVLVLSLFFIIPAVIFSHLEPEWDYLDALYYCFISLTTIGLGDYVPADSSHQEYRPLYKVCSAFYLLIGLTFMMFFLSVLYTIPELNIGIFFLAKSDDVIGTAKTNVRSRYPGQFDDPEPTIRHVKTIRRSSSSSEDDNP